MVLDLRTLKHNLVHQEYEILLDTSKLVVAKNASLNKFHMIYSIIFHIPNPDIHTFDKLEIIAKSGIEELSLQGKSYGLFDTMTFPNISQSKMNQKIINIVLLSNYIDQSQISRFNKNWKLKQQSILDRITSDSIITVSLYDRQRRIIYHPQKISLDAKIPINVSLKELSKVFTSEYPINQIHTTKTEKASTLLSSSLTKIKHKIKDTEYIKQRSAIRENTVDEETFQKIIQLYTEIEINDLAKLLNVHPQNLKKWLISQSDYGFKINKNTVIINQDEIGDHIDRLFDDFEKAEQTHHGKIE